MPKKHRRKGVISTALDTIESPFSFIDETYKDIMRDLRRIMRGFEDSE